MGICPFRHFAIAHGGKLLYLSANNFFLCVLPFSHALILSTRLFSVVNASQQKYDLFASKQSRGTVTLPL